MSINSVIRITLSLKQLIYVNMELHVKFFVHIFKGKL